LVLYMKAMPPNCRANTRVASSYSAWANCYQDLPTAHLNGQGWIISGGIVAVRIMIHP
jgi:hypothetical protein